MNKLIKRQSINILFIFCLVSLYLATRLAAISNIPIFTDEAIYVRWSQIGLFDAAHRFIPLTDGKTPLFHWLTMISMSVIPDPLTAGRLVSVSAGLMNVGLMWLLGWLLTKRSRVAHIAALAYVLSPFMLVYDRLAVVDSLLTTFSITSFILATLLVKYLRLDTALLLGISIGLGMLTKSTGLLFLLLSPGALLLTDLKQKKLYKRFGAWLALWLLAAFISEIMFNSLRVSNLFFRIEQKNHEFILTTSEFLANPFTLFWGNIQSLIKWQIGYLTFPATLALIVAFFDKRFIKEKILLFLYFLGPFLVIATFNKVIFARYLVFSAPFLLVLVAFGVDFLMSQIKKPEYKLIPLVLIFSLATINSATLLINPSWARIPQSEKDQYIQGKPSGIGVMPIIDFIKSQAQKEKVFLGTDGTFGLTPDAFDIYLKDEPNVTVRGYYPVSTIPSEVAAQASQSATYFVYYNVQDIPLQENIELVEEYAKKTPTDVSYLRLYKVKPLEE